MSRSKGSLKGVTKLGAAKTEYESKYNPKLLECFENNFPMRDYWVRFTCPEFTAINPVNNEPYAATILINYIPDKLLVESKSLKLYLFSFRNSPVGGELAKIVLRDLGKLLSPKYIEVEVQAFPREGIEGRVMQCLACKREKYQDIFRLRTKAFRDLLLKNPPISEGEVLSQLGGMLI